MVLLKDADVPLCMYISKEKNSLCPVFRGVEITDDKSIAHFLISLRNFMENVAKESQTSHRLQ